MASNNTKCKVCEKRKKAGIKELSEKSSSISSDDSVGETKNAKAKKGVNLKKAPAAKATSKKVVNAKDSGTSPQRSSAAQKGGKKISPGKS